MSALQDFELVKIADIEIGERYRKNANQDIDKLAKSIEDIGLLNPVVLTSGLDLVAGHRRILACQSLGYDVIEAHFVHDLDEAALLLAEHDENVCRVPMTTGEARACIKAREILLKPLAEANTKSGTSASVRQTLNLGRVKDAAAAGTGKSRATIERVESIEKIANDPEQPEEVREIAQEVLDKVDDDQMPVNTGLETVKVKLAEAAGSREQAKVLKNALKAAQTHSAAITSAFLNVDAEGEYSPVENFDSDVTIDDVKAAAKQFRINFALINKALKMVGA